MPCHAGARTGRRGNRPDRGLAGLPERQPGQRARPPRGRRMRRGRARRRARHARLHLCRGGDALAGARLPRGLRPANFRLRSPLRQQGLSLHRRLPAVRRGGPLGRRRLRRRAAHGAARRLRPGPHPHARQQQERRGDPLRRPRRRRPPDPRLLRRDRALRASAGGPPGRADPRHPGDQAVDPRLHHHRPARLEVRLRARGRPRRAGDRAGARLRHPEPRRPARPHRLADLRARALHAGDPRARRAGRRVVPPGQRRRRPRRRLHR